MRWESNHHKRKVMLERVTSSFEKPRLLPLSNPPTKGLKAMATASKRQCHYDKPAKVLLLPVYHNGIDFGNPAYLWFILKTLADKNNFRYQIRRNE